MEERTREAKRERERQRERERERKEIIKKSKGSVSSVIMYLRTIL
jgi:hypothetical protein